MRSCTPVRLRGKNCLKVCAPWLTQPSSENWRRRATLLRLLACSNLGVRSIAMSVSVCLSVRSHISKTTCPNFTKFSVRVNCGRGSVFSDDSAVRYVLPVLWMTSCFHISGPGKGDASRAYSQSDSPGQHRGRSLMPAIALLTAGMHSKIDDDEDDGFQIHRCQYGLGHLLSWIRD